MARRHCEACSGATPILTPAEVEAWRAEIPHWTSHGDRLRRTLTFANFGAAFAMATRIALLAESEGHHPELSVGWGRLDVQLTTHAVGGITLNDLVMAARIDGLLRTRPD